MARIVLNTFGSFGDIHPYLALAITLRKRGHDAILATSETYRDKVLEEGIAFAPVRPDVGELIDNEAFRQRLWHPVRGTEYLIREYLLPALPASYADLSTACLGADLLVTHPAGYAGPIVAEKLRLRWLSTALQPLIFLSAYEPPVLAPAPWLPRLRVFGPAAVRAVLRLGLWWTQTWARPIHALRARLALSPLSGNPFFEAQFSPFGTLALFSKYFAQPQPDWPANVQVCGFPFYDRFGPEREAFTDRGAMPVAESVAALEDFLRAGDPPVLFTLGSSAVMNPGSFYAESFQAARQLGIRAILLAGRMPASELGHPLPPNIFVGSYAPYSLLMPRCAATVHQGGIGTTAQALRSGKPMIVVPWAHDQADNAAHSAKLGVGRSLKRHEYTAKRVAKAITSLLRDHTATAAAQDLGAKIQAEDGINRACDAMEAALTGAGSPPPM